MPYLCGAVLTATYFYVLLLSINATAHLEDNDADTAININDSNNNNNYLKRQLKKYHWRPYQLPQQQRHHHHHNKEHTQTPELPRKEPIFERSQEIASNSGRTRSRALRHHSRSSSSRRHRVSISRNTVGAGDDDHASGVGDVTSGGQRLNKGKKLLFRDHGLQIEVFEDIIGKLMQLSRDGSVQSAQISSGILGLALDPNYYELWKEGPQKQDQPKQQQQQQQQQQLLHLYLQRQRQQKQQLKEEHSLAHKKPRHSVYVCPKKDSSFQLACPGLDSSGTTTCIRDTELCDGVIHCPDGEDENSTVCMFYTMIRNAINKITQTLFENLPRK